MQSNTPEAREADAHNPGTAASEPPGVEPARPTDLSLKGFGIAAVREVTNLDSELLATLRALLLRPGLLTHEYVSRRSGRFMSPLRTFLVANVLYFAVHTFFIHGDTFTTHLTTQLETVPAVQLKRALVERKIAAEESSLESLSIQWDAVAAEHGKTLVVMVIPIYAIISTIILLYLRRPIVQHIVFAIHFVSFVLLALILFPLVMAPVFLMARITGVSLQLLATDTGGSLLLGGVFVAYLFPGLRRAYNVGRPAALLLAAILVVGFLVALQLYRFALFFSIYFAL